MNIKFPHKNKRLDIQIVFDVNKLNIIFYDLDDKLQITSNCCYFFDIHNNKINWGSLSEDFKLNKINIKVKPIKNFCNKILKNAAFL